MTSLARVADSLNRNGRTADVRQLARMVVVGVGIGNLDMHTKNLGLLLLASGDVRLAPAYDFVPSAHQSNTDGQLALAVDGDYRHAHVTQVSLVAEFSSWGVRRAEKLVSETLEELQAAASAETPLAASHPALHDDVSKFIRNLLAGKRAGAS